MSKINSLPEYYRAAAVETVRDLIYSAGPEVAWDPLVLQTILVEAFRRGVAEGIRAYAVHRNGEQLVGSQERQLRDVLHDLEVF